MSVDVLAFGAHPDDVELGVGGIVHKLTSSGHSVAIADLTCGELSSRGTVQLRTEESMEAARRLGVLERVSLELPDGHLATTGAQREAVLRAIRLFRPRILLAPMTPDRHPDHEAAHLLVRSANFLAGLQKLAPGEKPCRAERVYYYHAYYEPDVTPSVIMDVSEHFEAKLNALRAYQSQFHNPEFDGPETLISSEQFWKNIEHRAARLGSRIDVNYGEALFSLDPIGVTTLPGLERA